VPLLLAVIWLPLRRGGNRALLLLWNEEDAADRVVDMVPLLLPLVGCLGRAAFDFLDTTDGLAVPPPPSAAGFFFFFFFLAGSPSPAAVAVASFFLRGVVDLDRFFFLVAVVAAALASPVAVADFFFFFFLMGGLLLLLTLTLSSVVMVANVINQSIDQSMKGNAVDGTNQSINE